MLWARIRQVYQHVRDVEHFLRGAAERDDAVILHQQHLGAALVTLAELRQGLLLTIKANGKPGSA